MDKERTEKSDKANIFMVGVQQYAEILKLTKPSVYLLHGYYPGGRNNS